jgi:hypothetical protein
MQDIGVGRSLHLWAQWMESGQELVFFLSIYNKLFLALPQGLLSNEQRLIKGKVFEDKYFFTVYWINLVNFGTPYLNPIHLYLMKFFEIFLFSPPKELFSQLWLQLQVHMKTMAGVWKVSQN